MPDEQYVTIPLEEFERLTNNDKQLAAAEERTRQAEQEAALAIGHAERKAMKARGELAAAREAIVLLKKERTELRSHFAKEELDALDRKLDK